MRPCARDGTRALLHPQSWLTGRLFIGAFSALVATIIGFALWGRRTMVRLFERAINNLTEDLPTNRQRLEALLDALRALGQRNPEVGATGRSLLLTSPERSSTKLHQTLT